MNNKKLLIVLGLAFVVLMAGAGILYNRLGGAMAPDQLTVTNTTAAEQADETTEANGETEGQKDSESPETVEEAQESGSEETEPQAMLAPDFTVYDADGNAVRLSDYKGKPVVMNFWATWCGYCKMEMPDFQEKYLELGEDVQFLMINVTDGDRETVEKAKAYVEEHGFTFPVVYDTDMEASMTYGAYSLPMTIFIDAEGYGIAQATGAIDAQTLQRGIDMIWTPES